MLSASVLQIPQAEFRAITLCQMSSMARFIQLVLNTCTLIDANEFSPTQGEWVTWQMINMYHIAEHFVRPLTGAAPTNCPDYYVRLALAALISARLLPLCDLTQFSLTY